ncbi:fork head domain protein [Rhizoctonia solani 123E]|uniref:Fork head domain protein n=1 Tax=Rhizoctonia solani 123E TaxID=1423351 RepID=A0A074S1G7_9AGAM|nr:fork head domain protein [Rhizoctonia solani 123E]
MTVDSTTTTSTLVGSIGSSSHETQTQQLPLSPPISSEDQARLPRERNKIIHQIQHRASPSDSNPSTTTTALSETTCAPNPAIHRPETVRVKTEIRSPSPSLGPLPLPEHDPDITLRPTDHQLGVLESNLTDTPSSPTARALRSLGLTRADLAQHAQRMKSFLGAGGRRGFPSAADLASAEIKPEPTDSDMLLTQSSASSIHRQASYASSVCTTTTTDISRASSTYPTGPSTSTSFDTTPSRHRRTARGKPILPPLPPSSPPPMLSPALSGESNRTGINSSPIRSPLASPSQPGPSRPYAATDYANPNDPPYTLPPGPRPREKPAASYAALIGQAIMSAIPGPDAKKKLTLAQIYAWISAAWPFYKPGEAGWMNSIRHNLSLNDCFVKIKRDGREKGKGSFWGIRQGDEDMFANGGFVRRNSAAKKRKKEPTPTRDEPVPVEPIKRTRTNTAPAAPNYVYEPPRYPPLPGTSRTAIPKASAASTQASKRARAAPTASSNKKSYRSPVGDHPPSSSPARAESGKRAQRQEPPPELTPNMSSSPDIPASSPISSSPPPQSNDGSAERPTPSEYSTKSGLMDMIINNSAKKRKVSGSGVGSTRLGALGNGSPVMKRRPNGAEEEPRTIYPASMLNRPGSPTQHINPRATLKTRAEQHTRRESPPPVVRPEDLRTSSRGSEPVTPPRTLEKSNPFSESGSGGLDRPQFVALKPSDIIPTTPPRTLAPLTVATSAERTPLSHTALHMSPSRPSDLSHFKTSLYPPSNDFTTPLMMRRVPSLGGIMLAMPTESPLRTPLGYGGARDINDLNSGCAEELMMTPASRLAIAGTAPGNEQSPSMLFGGMYRSPDGTWGPRPHW